MCLWWWCCWRDFDEPGFNGIYLVIFGNIQNVGDIDF